MNDIIEYGPLKINLKEHNSYVGIHKLRLTKSEQKILEILACYDRIVSNSEVAENLYFDKIDKEPEYPESCIKVVISHIRKKIKQHYSKNFIRPYNKFGYRLVNPE